MNKLAIALFLIPILSFSQGKLSKAKQRLSSRTNSSVTNSSVFIGGNAGNTRASLLADLFIDLFAFVGYKAALGEFEQRHFTPYPYYYSNVNGEYDFGNEQNDKTTHLRLGTNYLISNVVNSIELNARYRFDPLFGIDLHHQSFFERVRNGTDYLDVSSIGVNYYRIRERAITAWWGMGLSYIGSGVNQFGFMYQLGVEFYPFRPFSLHFSFQQSLLDQNNLGTLRTQLKFHQKKTAYYLGYHDISLAGIKASGVVLGIEFSF